MEVTKQGGPQQCCQTQGGTLETIQPFPLPQQRRLMFLYFFYCGLDNQLVFLVRVLGSVNKSQWTGKLSKYPKINYHPVIHRTVWLIAWMASKHSMEHRQMLLAQCPENCIPRLINDITAQIGRTHNFGYTCLPTVHTNVLCRTRSKQYVFRK
jgi:hypothetical protein